MVMTCHAPWQLSWQADCKKASIGTASHLGSTNGRSNHFSLPCKSTISGTVGSFQSGGAFATGRTLTIVNSPMSGYCKGHEPPENALSLLPSYIVYY